MGNILLLGRDTTVASGAPLAITTSSLNAMTQGTPFSQVLEATGGSGTYVEWMLIGGSLPAFNAGPIPLPGLALNYTGVLQGMLYLPGSGSATFQVRDSAGAVSDPVTLDWVVNAAAPGTTWDYTSGNAQPQYIDPADSAQWLSPNGWNGHAGDAFQMWNGRRWVATVPVAFNADEPDDYPMCVDGFYPQGWINPCIPANGGSSTAPGVALAIQISALTQAALRSLTMAPIDRTQIEWNGLKDMYVVSGATPAAGVTSGDGYTVNETLAAFSVIGAFVDTQVYWETFIGVANSTALAKATLSRSVDYVGIGTGNGANTTAYYGCIEMDGRMWFVALANENWAKTPAAGLCNTIRMFPAPWNELHQVGPLILTIDVGNMLRDFLASDLAQYVNFTAADFLCGLTDGVEVNGGITRYALTAATATNPLSVTVATPPVIAVNDRVGFGQLAGMTQLNKLTGTVSAVNASTGVITVGDIDASAFSGWTSGGYIHKAVFEFDTQTALQTDTPPAIYLVPEISRNVSRRPSKLPIYAGPDAGGIYVAANAVTADYNKWVQSNAKPTTGAPFPFAFNINGLSQADLQFLLLHWIGVYNNQSGNNGFYNAGTGNNSDWLPGTYTIDVNPSTSSVYPTSGWVTRVTVTGSALREMAHFLGDCRGMGWVRINVTALGPKDQQDAVAFHIDLLSAPNTTGQCDGHAFVGDSHDNKYMLCGDTEEGGASDYFGNIIQSLTGHNPFSICMGNSAWTLCPNSAGYSATLPYLNGTNDDWIASFPGRFVWYMLGFNEPAASVSPATYIADLTSVVTHWLSLGKTVIICSIMFDLSSDGATSTTWSGYNTEVLNAFAGNPNVIAGPDLNTWWGNWKIFGWNTHDDTHLAPFPQATFKGLMADWAARVLYLGQNPATYVPPFELGTGPWGMGGVGGSG